MHFFATQASIEIQLSLIMLTGYRRADRSGIFPPREGRRTFPENPFFLQPSYAQGSGCWGLFHLCYSNVTALLVFTAKNFLVAFEIGRI